ncbi:Protein of unknown function DUF3531 [Macleaya cordata]|uniref:Uncharacterized protein n=1 Tax=Macleaya cordata TaxID=56857 RepID=A0A200QJZ4_MACCD|nr:Protein of unknown function DUF3531 [Macleaya cordata]
MNCYTCCSSSSFINTPPFPSSSSSSSSSSTSFLLLRHHGKSLSHPSLIITTHNQNLIKVRARRRGRDVIEDDDSGEDDVFTSATTITEVPAKGSGTTARGRRLLKVREEKRKREYDRLHNYPSWAKVLEDACKEDTELRAVLGDSIGNPDLMRQRVIQSWYVMGRLGAFNSSNLQLANSSMEYDPLYDADKGFNVMPSSFHDIGDVEFQDNWGRVWVDIGTCDFFAIDVLLNCLTVLSSEYLGIQQVVFGGRRMGDWEEGMTSPEDGYKYFKI